MLDRVDRVDTRKRCVERLSDAWGRPVGSVDDLPRGRQAALPFYERPGNLLPLLVVHRASVRLSASVGRNRLGRRRRPSRIFAERLGSGSRQQSPTQARRHVVTRVRVVASRGTPAEHGAAKMPQTAELSAKDALGEVPVNRPIRAVKWLPW